MTKPKKMLESRLDCLAKQVAFEKLVKMKRYRMIGCSIGLSVVVFVTYSIISPIPVSEEYIYSMKKNRASSLSDVPISTKKTKMDKPPQIKKVPESKAILPPKTTVITTTKESLPVNKKMVADSPTEIEKRKEDASSATVPQEAYPVWDDSVDYQVGDRVTYKDHIYEANQANSGKPPDEKGLIFGGYWDEVKE
jgi:predicted small secreted protein